MPEGDLDCVLAANQIAGCEGVIDGQGEAILPDVKRMNERLGINGLSLADLARGIGASPQSLNHWRHRGIPKPFLALVAAFLGCSVDWLLTGEDDAVDLTSHQAFLTSIMGRGVLSNSEWALLRTMAESLMSRPRVRQFPE